MILMHAGGEGSALLLLLVFHVFYFPSSLEFRCFRLNEMPVGHSAIVTKH